MSQEIQDFFTRILPARGPYCAVLEPTASGSSKGQFARAYDTIGELVTCVTSFAPTHHVYYTPHALHAPRIWNPRKKCALPPDAPVGQTTGGWSVRTQANMREARALYVDLDVGKSKGYATQGAALTALKTFCADMTLALPTIVSSGHGVHAYWTFTRPAPSNGEWRTMAAMLKELCRAAGLHIDPAVTSDSARILRAPGSLNRKRADVRPVRVLAYAAGDLDPDLLLAHLRRLVDARGLHVAASAAAPQTEDASPASTAPSEYDGPVELLDDVLGACAQLRRMRDAPETVSEPEWYAALGVVVHTVEGLDAAHTISKGHPGYSYDETQAKAERARLLPPTGCAKLRDVSGDNGTICAGCAFFGRVKGPTGAARLAAPNAPPIPVAALPLVAGSNEDETPADPIVIPDPPPPYKRMRDGTIVLMTTSAAGLDVVVPVFKGELYPVRRMRERSGPDTQHWRYHNANGEAPRDIFMTGGEFVSNKLIEIVANHGVYVENAGRLEKYMSHWLRHLAARDKAADQHATMGWTEGYANFVLGDTMITPAGVKPALLTDTAQNVGRPLRTGGTLEGQVAALAFYDADAYVAHQFYIAASLAAAWLYPTRQLGLIINALGPGGASKTTTLRAAAGIWGDPTNYIQSGLSHNHTRRGLEMYAETLSNLPICLDELSLMTDDEARSFVMGASQRGSGPKGARGGGLKEMSDSRKHAIYMTNSNRSLIDMTGGRDDDISAAAAMRVFEAPFSSMTVHSKTEADKAIGEMLTHYGHIGRKVMATLVPHRAKVETAIITRMATIDKALGITPQERFRSALIAPTLTMMDVMRAQHLTTWRSEHAMDWLRSVQIGRQRRIDDDQKLTVSATAILGDFFQRNLGSTLALGRGAHNAYLPDREPTQRIAVHYDVNAARIWVSRTAFKEYCHARGANAGQVIEALAEQHVIIETDARFTLGTGTRHAVARARCFTVDANHPDIAAGSLRGEPQGPPPTTDDNVVPLHRSGTA